ncbi:MAG: hypothetical protein DPW09_32900 [Anaerolineae bacterium]|nr:hypothetical protein [Anaerolineales bacterium]MCQ3978251.1 hypothetical protein [Anaerolineae bacterium]
MKSRALFQTLIIAFGLLLSTLFSLWQVQQISQAQGGGQITLTKTLDRSSNVVRVGEVLTFTIGLTNNSVFTLTGVTLIDNYDNTTLAFARAFPPESLISSGTLTWNNVAAPPILPGQSIFLTVVFTAEHPRTTVVNAVRAQDLIHSSGQLSETAETSRTNEAIGGSAPIVKFLAPGVTPEAGQPVTFTHIITNDGAALMTSLPLTDTYDPTYLDFLFAIPTPTITSPPGLLAWDDLTDYFGDIQPFATVVITTVFSATTQVLNTVNQASTEGARDQYDNNLTAGLAQVPITIINPTPSRDSDNNNDNDNDNDNDNNNDTTSAPTATAVVVNTPTPTATPAANQTITTTTPITDMTTPKFLPETGLRGSNGWLILGLGSGLLLLSGYLFKELIIDRINPYPKIINVSKKRGSK